MVHSQRQRAFSAAPAAARHSAFLRKKTKAPYKIVLEQVTEKRRKLLTVLSFNANAPPGYTFIPAGDPQITNRCKQVAREDGRKVYIVSTSKHKHKGILSHEVHRIGHHFPSTVVEKACTSLGVSLTQHGHVLPSQRYQQAICRNPGPQYNAITNPIKQNLPMQEDVSQAILDMQAREAIKDLFPKIPEKDLHDIICRAFKKGKDRVGTVLELPLSRRVQLAVVAHIRHVYTDYDKLLKTGTYQKARAAVEKPCLDLLARWRSDDDDDDPNAMEEILREVIVIDDDDDEINDCKSSLGNRESINRESSIEIISSHVLPDEVQVHQVDYGGPAQLVHVNQPYSPEFMDSEIVRRGDLELLPALYHSRGNLSSFDRNGIHHHRWQEALDRHRTNLVPIHPGKHELLAQNSAVRPRESIFYTELEPRQLRIEDQSREPLPLETVKTQNVVYLGSKGKENIPQRRLDLAERSLRPDPPKTREVVLPTEVYLRDRRESLKEPMRLERIQQNDNGYSHDEYSEQPRITTSEERITHARDRISARDFIDPAHNYQSHHVTHRIPQQISRSVESKTLQTNDVKDPFNILYNRSFNHPDESFRLDQGVDFRPRVIHVNDTEARHSKRRRFEELEPVSSDRYRQYDSSSRSDRTALIPLDRGDRWADSHEQLSPVAPSIVNPFIRQDSNVYVRPVEAIRCVDRETVPRAVPYEASSPSLGPMRAFESDEALHPSSHSLRNLPTRPRQTGHDFLYSTVEAPGKASLVPSFRDERMRLQSSHESYTLSNSSRDAYGHPPRDFPHGRFIDPLEHRPIGQQQHEQDLRSDFARLDTGSRYVSENSKPSIDGFETHRGNLIPAHPDRSPELLHGESPTCIFLRKLPGENYALPKKAKSSSSTTRFIYQASSSPRGDSGKFLPFDAGNRVSQTWGLGKEKAQVDSWQDNSRLANDQRTYNPRIEQIPRGNNVRWEPKEPREIIVID